MNSDSTELVDSIFQHLVLPPKISESFEDETYSIGSSIERCLQNACATLRRLFPDDQMWEGLEDTLKEMVKLNQGLLVKDNLIASLKRLCDTAFRG